MTTTIKNLHYYTQTTFPITIPLRNIKHYQQAVVNGLDAGTLITFHDGSVEQLTFAPNVLDEAFESFKETEE